MSSAINHVQLNNPFPIKGLCLAGHVKLFIRKDSLFDPNKRCVQSESQKPDNGSCVMRKHALSYCGKRWLLVTHDAVKTMHITRRRSLLDTCSVFSDLVKSDIGVNARVDRRLRKMIKEVVSNIRFSGP